MSPARDQKTKRMKTIDKTRVSRTHVPDDVAREIIEAVESIDFGAVEIVIHNGRVVQIEARRKRRFDDQRTTS